MKQKKNNKTYKRKLKMKIMIRNLNQDPKMKIKMKSKCLKILMNKFKMMKKNSRK